MTLTNITVQTTINNTIEIVWDSFTNPEHIIHWNFASDDWHCPYAKNDLVAGGSFTYHMAAKDGSFGFDFGGVFDEIMLNKLLRMTLGDGRKIEVHFKTVNNQTEVTETFEAENQNPIEMQRIGWQMIMDNFKKHTETI